MADWHKLEWDDETTHPKENGLYAVWVHGDSEYVDGHCIYDFLDYWTFATYTNTDTELGFVGQHDEEPETMYAWYGPIVIPELDI